MLQILNHSQDWYRCRVFKKRKVTKYEFVLNIGIYNWSVLFFLTYENLIGIRTCTSLKSSKLYAPTKPYVFIEIVLSLV